MKPYHLAKLIQWAPGGELKSRKRMQKVVFLLQAAKFTEYDAEFILHLYGPYSPDVAARTDQMVANGLLAEREEPGSTGSTYAYQLTPQTRRQLAEFERTTHGVAMASTLVPAAKLAKKLLAADLRALEYGATIAFFYCQEPDWTKAVSRACKFKRVSSGNRAMHEALKLARLALAGK